MNANEIIKKIPELKITPELNDAICIYDAASSTYFDLSNGLEYTRSDLSRGCVDRGCDGLFNDENNRIRVVGYSYNMKQALNHFISFQYLDEIQSIVCMLVKVDYRARLFKVPAKPQIEEMFFITSNKTMITKFNGEWVAVTDDLVDYLPFYFDEPMLNNNDMSQAFNKLFPVVYLKASTAATLNNYETLLQFLAHKEQKKKTGPKQKLIDELTSIDLEPIDPDELVDIDKEYNQRSNFQEVMSYAKISKVKDGVCCIRYIIKNCTNSTITENVRIYVDKKNAIACKKNNRNEYIQLMLHAGKRNFEAKKLLPFDKSILKDTMLQYFGDIFTEIAEDYQIMCIWSFIQYPILEKAYKIGLKEIVKQGLKSWESNPTSGLSHYFGNINTKAKTILKALGINKHQLNAFLDDVKGNNPNTFITNIKEILTDGNSIDAIDNNTFDTLYHVFKSASNTWYVSDILMKLNNIYSSKTMLNMSESIIEMAKHTKTTHYSENNYLQMYRDYLITVEQMNDNKHYRPQYDSLDDIKEMHDAAVSVYNLKKEEYRYDAFVKHIKKWEKYAYANEEYSVIIPQHPHDLANEGIILHHCVKSYIDRVSAGVTNIVFIRKTNEIDKPFFTVEISNSDVVEQIHGFANRNMCTEPGLDKFVKEWTEARKLKCNNVNKVR